MSKKWLYALLAALLSVVMLLSACTQEDADLLGDILTILTETESLGSGTADDDYTGNTPDTVPDDLPSVSVSENKTYSSKEDVSEYLYLYGHLPKNYLTKNEASDLGWVSSKGNLWEVAPGMSIGGDKFGNREGILPKNKQYYECDIDYNGGYRNEKRIVYTKDGWIYYTEDHYETFEQLYP
jgi:guanyl-specific ribonuclease Sa